MGITRFKRTEDPTPQLGKGDYEFYYSGTVQTGDDLRIPAKSKRQDSYVDQLAGHIRGANTGQSVILKFYKGVTLLGQVAITVSSADTLFTTPITRQLIEAGSMMIMTITQVGTVALGITVSGYVRVCR